MYDFAYRVAIDTYEQMNGKIKLPDVVYEQLDAPARLDLLRRIARALRERRLHRPVNTITQQPSTSPSGVRG